MDPRPDKQVIVIVEDTVEIAELIKDALNDEPTYQAVVVVDGARALEVIQSVRASLILLDYHLPGLTGLQIYDLLQQDPATQAIPVLFLTSSSRDPVFTTRGFTNVFAKPFDLVTLLQAVAQQLDPASRPAGPSAATHEGGDDARP
jgi:CheY-like chemotaxis protein